MRIFTDAPTIVSIALDATHEYLVTLQYLQTSWTVAMSRQRLLQLHASLKIALALHHVLDATATSIMEHEDEQPSVSMRRQALRKHQSSAHMVVLGRSGMPRSPVPATATATAAATTPPTTARLIKRDSMHFPRRILPGRRPLEDAGAALVREYLEHVFSIDEALNHKLVLELMCVSSMSFDPRYLPSVYEGWCLLERRPAHESDLEWHTVRMGRLVLGCACFPASSYSLPKHFWLVHKRGFLAFLRDPLDEFPSHVLFLGPGLVFKKGFSQSGGHRHVLISSASWASDIRFFHRIDKKRYLERVEAVTMERAADCRYGSFAPTRRQCTAQFLVDGHEYFAAVADAMEAAERDVFIQGWWVCADVRLKRGTGDDAYWSLKAIVQRACDRGVVVRVLMYGEVSLVLPLSSKLQEVRLGSNPNLFVIRHPVHNLRAEVLPLYWSHHEKIVVVDHATAFVGGIDLAWGRYDTEDHRLFGDAWAPGIDFMNPRIKDITDAKRIDERLLDPGVARMPWHDVAVKLKGAVANDVAVHFAQQWSFAVMFSSKRREWACAVDVASMGALQEQGTADVQVVRSQASWSGGPDEHSIHAAYLDVIARACKGVYVENQFFQSGMHGDAKLGNRVVDALYTRLLSALTHPGEDGFRCILVLPLLPAFEGKVSASDSIRSILHWQLCTLVRGPGSLVGRLLERCTQAELDDRLLVLGLRTFDSEGQGTLVTEQVYVHSKVLIADDETAVVGSANINDRSLLGSRDSEVNVVVKDRASVRALRERLFREHFGGDGTQDWTSAEGFRALRAQAFQNTKLFAKVFGLLAPSDQMRTFGDVQRFNAGAPVELGQDNMFRSMALAKNPLATTGRGAQGTDDADDADSGGKALGEVVAQAEAEVAVPTAADGHVDAPMLQAMAEAAAAAPVKKTTTTSGDDEDGEGGEESAEVARLRMRLGGWGPDATRLSKVRGHAVLWPMGFLRDETNLLPSDAVNAILGEAVYQ